MNLSDQITFQQTLRDDMVDIHIESAVVDGTERHAVRRITWKVSGQTTGTRAECGRTIRPFSLSTEKPVTCKHCLRYI